MRRKGLVFLTVCIYLAAMAFGIVKRQTYTDLAKQENYLDQVVVAELPEGLANTSCEKMSQILPDSALILRVEATGEIEHLFLVDRQRAVIRQVYAGDGLEEGEEICLFSGRWQLIADEEEQSIQRGFVNIMEVGTEYLVFAESVGEDWKTDISLVKVNAGDDEFVIAPVFCYEERQNVITPISGGTTYVPYKDVKDNEFFAASEEALQVMLELKNRMLSLYPREKLIYE